VLIIALCILHSGSGKPEFYVWMVGYTGRRREPPTVPPMNFLPPRCFQCKAAWALDRGPWKAAMKEPNGWQHVLKIAPEKNSWFYTNKNKQLDINLIFKGQMDIYIVCICCRWVNNIKNDMPIFSRWKLALMERVWV